MPRPGIWADAPEQPDGNRADWRGVLAATQSGRAVLPLPHPSWRNSGWIKRNPWFEAELLPELKGRISNLLLEK
jgi:uracil-DNA glycosylase